MDRLRYHRPEPSRDGLDDPDPFVVSSALVGHALTGDDRLELESMCRQLAEHADQGVRDTAGLCLGHIGRGFGEIEDAPGTLSRRWPAARTATADRAMR